MTKGGIISSGQIRQMEQSEVLATFGFALQAAIADPLDWDGHDHNSQDKRGSLEHIGRELIRLEVSPVATLIVIRETVSKKTWARLSQDQRDQVEKAVMIALSGSEALGCHCQQAPIICACHDLAAATCGCGAMVCLDDDPAPEALLRVLPGIRWKDDLAAANI